jgi:hypothetical protein
VKTKKVALDPQLAWDEGRRLFAEYKSCLTEKFAVVEQLSNPRYSMLYPVYKTVADQYEAIRVRCDEKRIELKTHREKCETR